ncbi:DotU family type IV/VI secretion system protein [Kluyvera sichuanensis]|uniref:DotU family type IV/VI secretion system protein n=1 Tax=Kluyvera sichuanensis TaxID=2725494 RepID=UPI0039F572B7
MDLSKSSHALNFSGNTNASTYIDVLLQDTYLFVMTIHHQPAQVRDEALYHYAVRLVEAVQEKLKATKEHDEFINHIIYAQCAMMDDAVLNTASQLENAVWLHNPLQARFVMQMQAGEVMFERVRALLHQISPDPRLLVLYQRLFGMGFSQNWSERYRDKEPDGQDKREHTLGSLNALVPDGDLPLSAPLVVERSPTVRGRLLHSRLAHILLALLVTAGLIAGLQYSLHHLLQTALPG